jgi:hypothetical protein
MAREVDPVTKLLLDKKLPQGMNHDAFMWFLKRFEALVREDEREETNRRANASWALMCEKMVAAEREACAKVCEEMQEEYGKYACAYAIRARGNK